MPYWSLLLAGPAQVPAVGGVSQAYQGFPNAVASLLPEGERICQSHVEDRHKILGHDAAVATNDPAANVFQERVSKGRHRPTG